MTYCPRRAPGARRRAQLSSASTGLLSGTPRDSTATRLPGGAPYPLPPTSARIQGDSQQLLSGHLDALARPPPRFCNGLCACVCVFKACPPMLTQYLGVADSAALSLLPPHPPAQISRLRKGGGVETPRRAQGRPGAGTRLATWPSGHRASATITSVVRAKPAEWATPVARCHTRTC